jgi:hypothetical protein
MVGTWEEFAYKAAVDLAKAQLSRTNGEALEHLKHARETLDKAIDVMENAEK